jgi:hypothetical protein
MEIVDLRPRTGGGEGERERAGPVEWEEGDAGRRGSLQERIAADSQGCGIGRGPLSSAPAPYIYTRQRRFFEILFSSSSSRPWMGSAVARAVVGVGLGTARAGHLTLTLGCPGSLSFSLGPR